MVPIVQLVRASDCGSECRGFESHWAPKENKRKSLINKEFPLFLFSYSHSRSFYKQLLNITSNTKCFSTKLLKLKTRHYNKATFISTDEEIRKKPPTLVCRRLKEFFFLEIYRTLERCGIQVLFYLLNAGGQTFVSLLTSCFHSAGVLAHQRGIDTSTFSNV